MAKLAVTIQLEMEVPDTWELVKTEDGIEVLKIGDSRFLDLTFEPMTTDDMGGTWTNSFEGDLASDIIDMARSENVTYRLEKE